MKPIKNIEKVYDIKYVDCIFTIEDISKCRINGVSSTAQTIKHLPFLKYELQGFKWSPKIDLEEGRVIDWPRGIKAIINFDVRSYLCIYFDKNYTFKFNDESVIPSYLQLDLIDDRESLNFTINGTGYIENWPNIKEIIKQLV